jgi:hypothetical protein
LDFNKLTMGVRDVQPLAEAFQDMAAEIREGNHLPNTIVTVLNYDWHATTKAIGEPKTIEGLWNLLRNPMADIGVALGEWRPPGGADAGEILPPQAVKNAGLGGGVYKVNVRQSGVVRYNCADSLDRTNAASFFGAVQVRGFGGFGGVDNQVLTFAFIVREGCLIRPHGG